MAQISLLGNPVQTNGEIPAIGEEIKDFKLVANDLSTKVLADFPGKKY